VRAAIRAARALVFPSLWYEGQPLTVLEAKGRHADHHRRRLRRTGGG
jgi:glycosyltransferase involved in cell wall biosynthesis